MLIDSTDWDALMSEDVSKSWSNWCQQFLSIMEDCIPKRTLPKRKNLPWLTKRLVRSIRKRNLLYKQGKLTGDLSKYKLLRNKVTSELRQAKRNFFKNLNPKKPKDFWKAVKYLNKQHSSIPMLIDEGGREAHTGPEKANMLNSFFSKCFNSMSAPLDESAYSGISVSGECLEDIMCNVDHVLELLLHLDISKASGPDGKENCCKYCPFYNSGL